MADKVTADEYKKAVDAVNKAYTQDSINAYKTAYNDAMKSGKSSNEAFSSASGLLKKIDTTGGTSGGSSTAGGSSNTNASDLYGDVSGVRSKDVGSVDYSNYQTTELGDLNKFGASAREMEKAKSGSISERNYRIAGNLYNQGITERADIQKYLESQPGFTEGTTDIEQNNTIDAIKARLTEIQREKEGAVKTPEATKEGEPEAKNGYWIDENGNYQKIHGYDEMDDYYKNLMDREDNATRKRLSNEWDADMQEAVKYTLDSRRKGDQITDVHEINKELHNIDMQSFAIQTEQTLRNAEESYNNLKQNWQYLGNLGMPGVSATKLQAIGDSISEAKTQLGELTRLLDLQGQAKEKQWEGKVLQYNQQIDNLMYDLKWKVGDEIINALSKYTTAELEGKLDTIDGITAFRKELLDELDSNLSGITSASLTQMRYINDQYQDIANKLYDYSQNANKVNTEMSAVKGYYVDGNGNAILNDQGQPIQVPQNAPMEPIFDKETGKLITFGLDENGQIVASVQQVYQGDATNMQSTIVSLLENGVSVQDILKYVPNADLKTVTELAKVVNQVYGADGRSLLWDGGNYTDISEDALQTGYDNFLAKYTTTNSKGQKVLKSSDIKGGQCGHFVNNYLQSLGIARLFTDPITEKTKNINSNEAKVGSVVIMNSPTSPEYGHVGIVTQVGKDGTLTILQSNKAGEEKVFVSKKNIDDNDVLGFFDPTKSIDQYNQERKGEAQQQRGEGTTQLGGYRDGYIGDYTNFLKNGTHGFSDGQRKQLEEIFGSWENFAANAEAYKTEINHQVGEVAMTMVDDMVDVLAWLNEDDNSINDLRFAMPGTKAWTMKSKYNQVMKSSALQKLIDLKSDGATFGALSDNELGFITDAADWFSLWGTEEDLKNGMTEKINKILSKSGMTKEQYLARRGQGGTTGGGDITGGGQEKVDLTSFSRGSW